MTPNETPSGTRRELPALVTGLPAILIVFVCSGLPLIWMAGAVIFASPAVRAELHINSFRAQLLARTLGYNGLAALLATLMGLPAAFVLGRGRGIVARLMWVVLPAALLMPSLSYAYGWSQAARLLRVFLQNHIGHRICSAVRPGLRARRTGGHRALHRVAGRLAVGGAGGPGRLVTAAESDSSIQQQALLDGGLLRVTLRQLLPSIIASVAIVTIIATQEFAVYEPTGISVVATEVRMVFDTGAVSSADNPIAGPVLTGLGTKSTDQPARAAAADATAMPLVLVTFLLAILVGWAASRSSAAETITIPTWPPVLDCSWRLESP